MTLEMIRKGNDFVASVGESSRRGVGLCLLAVTCTWRIIPVSKYLENTVATVASFRAKIDEN